MIRDNWELTFAIYLEKMMKVCHLEINRFRNSSTLSLMTNEVQFNNLLFFLRLERIRYFLLRLKIIGLLFWSMPPTPCKRINNQTLTRQKDLKTSFSPFFRKLWKSEAAKEKDSA